MFLVCVRKPANLEETHVEDSRANVCATVSPHGDGSLNKILDLIRITLKTIHHLTSSTEVNMSGGSGSSASSRAGGDGEGKGGVEEVWSMISELPSRLSPTCHRLTWDAITERKFRSPLRRVPATLSMPADVWALGATEGVAGAYVCSKPLRSHGNWLSFPPLGVDSAHVLMHTCL